MKQDFFVKYNYRIIKHIGSARGNLIFCILEHWFNIYPQGFYKFIDPCSHLLYRNGESWTEILGCHRTSFAMAFKLIGVKYSSRWEFEKAKDKFQGKLYASYYDRYTNQTFFVRNHDAVNALLSKMNASSGATHKSRKAIEQDPINPEFILIDNSVGTEKISRSYKEPKKTSIDLSKDKSHASNEIEKNMINIWVQVVEGGKKHIEMTGRLIAFLRQAFKDKFDNCLEKWKAFCERVASSRFLMGEIKPFRATLDWVLKFEVIQKILDGNYGIGDRNRTSMSSSAESFVKSSKLEMASEEEAICKSGNESVSVRVFRLKWLKKFGASNYRQCLKDCAIEVADDTTLILRPSSRYNAKSIASYWTPALLAGSLFTKIRVVQQEGDLVFDRWFLLEPGREGMSPENKATGVKVRSDLELAVEKSAESPEEVLGFLTEGVGEGISVVQETEMLRRKLKESLPNNQFPSWLETIEFEGISQDGTVVVTLEDSLSVSWCRSRFSNEVFESAGSLWEGVDRLVIRQKIGDTIPISIEKLPKKSEYVTEKSTLEKAIQSLLSVCSPGPMGVLGIQRDCESFG